MNTIKLNRLDLQPQTNRLQSERFDIKTRDILDQFLKNLSSIEGIFQDLFKTNRKKIIITNVGHHYHDPGFIYALSITKESIEYHEKKAKIPLHIIFKLENFVLSINGKEALAQSLDILIEKFQMTLRDLKEKQATIYESTLIKSQSKRR